MEDTPLKTLSRKDDPDTSHEAAEAISYRLSGLKMNVIRAMRDRERFTQHDVMMACNQLFGWRAESSYRHRVTDLANLGLMRRTDDRIEQSGSSRIVWEWTPKGLEVARNIG